MLPYTPLHHLLLNELDTPIVATSGNLSDEPICTDERDAMQRLGHIADLFLTHNRPIARHVDDSVAWVVDGGPQLLRRARGYAPLPVLVPGIRAAILGVGAHLKNTIALSVHETASEGEANTPGPTPVFLSQHIGDLETPEALAAFERVVDDFLHLYETTPTIVAHDMHPDYRSTRRAQEWAAARGWETMAVQHHHAHLAACLADNSETYNMSSSAPVLGVTWDGTGYGPDGTIWGGEWLLGNAAGYVRVAHLRPFLLPGGEAAVREPRRAALALLWDLAGDAALEWDDLAPVRSFSPGERQLLAGVLRRRVNAPTTTSAGRLFDAVAALIGLHQQTTFEGQAAIALEQVATPSSSIASTASTASTDEAYPFDLLQSPQQQPDGGPGVLVLDWRPLVAALLQDLRCGEEQGIMARRFHQSLIAAIVAVARRVNVSAVALTGGCFQNRLLTEQAAQRLREAGFTVLLHRQVPPNDSGISLGQVVVAATRGDRW
jgi:hydrogenase maturation protein HypF